MAHRGRLSIAGVYISKLARDCLSGNSDDQLIDPTKKNSRAHMSGILTSWTGTKYGPGFNGFQWYVYSIAHGLGYVPIFFGQSADADHVKFTADTVNFNIYAWSVANPSSSTFAFTGQNVSYVILYDQWI